MKALTTFKRKLRTASFILRNDGLGSLVVESIKHLKSGSPAASPDESQIAHKVLNAESSRGVMIDVGAHFGGSLRGFAESGWDVYAFEPDSRNRARLEHLFGNNRNVRIDPRGMSDRAEDNVTFYRSEESSGISGLSAFQPSHMPSETINIITLKQFIEEKGLEQVDFLKIDTEGFDLFVLRGFPWDRANPDLILCEFEDKKTVPLGYSFHELAGFLQDRGYSLIVSEWYPIVRYGDAHTWRRFTPYPCELLDERAWGNIIAVRETLYGGLLQQCGITEQ